jgi:hypothetical protein
MLHGVKHRDDVVEMRHRLRPEPDRSVDDV